MLCGEWDPYYFVKKTGYTNKPEEEDVEKDGKGSKEDTLIKCTANKASKITFGIDLNRNVH